MTAEDQPHVEPVEVTAENVEEVLRAAGCRGKDFGLISKGGEFIDDFVGAKTDPLACAVSDFPFDEIYRRLDGEPELCQLDTSMTRAQVAKLLSDVLGWIVCARCQDSRSVKLAGSRALAAAWVINPALIGEVEPSHTVAEKRGLHRDKFSNKAAEFSRRFKIQNPYQIHDAKNKRWAIL